MYIKSLYNYICSLGCKIFNYRDPCCKFFSYNFYINCSMG